MRPAASAAILSRAARVVRSQRTPRTCVRSPEACSFEVRAPGFLELDNARIGLVSLATGNSAVAAAGLPKGRSPGRPMHDLRGGQPI